jgi:hypothetical protein
MAVAVRYFPECRFKSRDPRATLLPILSCKTGRSGHGTGNFENKVRQRVGWARPTRTIAATTSLRGEVQGLAKTTDRHAKARALFGCEVALRTSRTSAE